MKYFIEVDKYELNRLIAAILLQYQEDKKKKVKGDKKDKKNKKDKKGKKDKKPAKEETEAE